MQTATSLAALALADKLDACAPPEASVSERRVPSLHARAAALVRERHHARTAAAAPDRGYRAQVLSLVPEFGRIPVGSLNTFDIDKFLDSVREALKACGIDHYKLGLDVSLNQRAGVTSPGFWQLQLWGFFHAPKRRWREQLKALLNPNGGVNRPVKVVKPNSLEAAAAYGVKSIFVRRVSYRKANLDREDRGECWNTRGRILRGDPWVELMLFLDRIGLQRRILLSAMNLSVAPATQPERPSTWGEQMTGDGSALRRRMRAMRMANFASIMSSTEYKPIAKHVAKPVVAKPMDKPKPV